MAESRDAVQRLDGEGVLSVWAESPDDDAALSQTALRWAVQDAVITRRTGTVQSLKRTQEGGVSGLSLVGGPCSVLVCVAYLGA